MAAHKGIPSKRCTVCGHLERIRIELLVAGGASHRAIATKYALSHFAVGRHWANHVSEERRANLILGPAQRQALAARVCEESESVLDHFKSLRAGLWQLFESALAAGDGHTASLLSGRLHENLNAIGKLTGQLANSPLVQQTTNIFMLPAFAEIQNALVRALTPHPAARADVVRTFREMEMRATAPPGRTPALIEQEPPHAT